jgi:hypothetical protein
MKTLEILFWIFFVLKLTGLIAWSWWLIFTPLFMIFSGAVIAGFLKEWVKLAKHNRHLE